MTRRLLLLSIVVLALSPRAVLAEPGYRVIVNAQNPITSVSKPLLSKLLLKTTTTWSNGNRVMPVDQRVSSHVRDAVSRAVHGRSATVIKNWWNQQIFAGKGVPPPELASDAKVVAYVLANPGAIGYVSADAAVGDAKVIAVTE
jgi:ABC-type phosphate transport system substrate-binding protein